MSNNKLGVYIQKLMTVVLDNEEEQFVQDLAYSELKRLNTDVGEFLLKNRQDDDKEEKEHTEKQLLLEFEENNKNG